MTWGIKASIENKDATKASPEESSLYSEYAAPKVRTDASPSHFGTISFGFANDPGTGTITNIFTMDHGLGYTPMNIMNWSNAARDRYGSGILSIGVFGTYRAYADNKQFKIDFTRSAIAGLDPTTTNYTFRYYIFAESGA